MVITVPTLDAALANVAKQVEGTFPTRIAQAFERGGKVRTAQTHSSHHVRLKPARVA